jgi:hypothetical protein
VIEVDREIVDIKPVKNPEDRGDRVQGLVQDLERQKDIVLVGIIKVVDLTIVDVIEDAQVLIQIIHPVQIQIEIQVKLELFHSLRPLLLALVTKIML